MKILLTHGYFVHEDAKELKIMRPYPPLGILYISAYLTENGYRNEVFDTTFSTKSLFKEYIKSNTPQVVGFYTNLMTKLNVIDLVQFVKTHVAEVKIIIGGPDVRYNAENYLKAGADFLVLGEGEETMLALVDKFKSDPSSIYQVEGIAFLEDNKVKLNHERAKIKDLDTLPFPARNKIDMHLYLDAWKKIHGKNAISISTMRGCPYTCKWCSRAVYGLSYRRRSPKLVAEEMLSIKRDFNPDSLWFVDDVFTISHKWLEAFRDELKKLQLTIPYECITRADRLNESVIQTLKDTGCFRVWIGAESGSQKVIDLMDRRVDVGQVRNMIRLSKKAGIETGTFIMLGYPGETEKDINETIQHLKESDPDHFTITIAYPIKGTELFSEVETINIDKKNWNNSTDRDIDFVRSYSRKYYDFAIKRVINEVNYFKSKNRNRTFAASTFKAKSIAAKIGMFLSR